MGVMREHTKKRSSYQVLVIAGVSGSGKTQLIEELRQPPHDEFILKVLKKLGRNPNQHLKRSTLKRTNRLIDRGNLDRRKTRKSKNKLVLFINLTSIHHKRNLKLLHQISEHAKRLDVITLYTSPQEWRQGILLRLHTDNEPSMRAAVIALSAKLSNKISTFLYHREYKKWCGELQALNINKSTTINTFNKTISSPANPLF